MILILFFIGNGGFLMSQKAIDTTERPPLLKTIPLSLQHLFAMFGSTVLVPILFHVNPATVLLFNGIGTLFYLILCKGKIPAYLGSSFAFLSPVFLVLSEYSYEAALGGFIVVGAVFCPHRWAQSSRSSDSS